MQVYDYVLEIDGAGQIIGGEWLGTSKDFHPDFLWYSFGHTSDSAESDDLWDDDNAAIRYSHFKAILGLAQAPAPGAP